MRVSAFEPELVPTNLGAIYNASSRYPAEVIAAKGTVDLGAYGHVTPVACHTDPLTHKLYLAFADPKKIGKRLASSIPVKDRYATVESARLDLDGEGTPLALEIKPRSYAHLETGARLPESA